MTAPVNDLVADSIVTAATDCAESLSEQEVAIRRAMEPCDYAALVGDLCIAVRGQLDWFGAEPARWINQAIGG